MGKYFGRPAWHAHAEIQARLWDLAAGRQKLSASSGELSLHELLVDAGLRDRDPAGANSSPGQRPASEADTIGQGLAVPRTTLVLEADIESICDTLQKTKATYGFAGDTHDVFKAEKECQDYFHAVLIMLVFWFVVWRYFGEISDFSRLRRRSTW